MLLLLLLLPLFWAVAAEFGAGMLRTAMVAAPPMPRSRSRGFWMRSSSSAASGVVR